MTPMHPLDMSPPDTRGKYTMCTCHGMVIPYPIETVYCTAIETVYCTVIETVYCTAIETVYRIAIETKHRLNSACLE